jgi:arylsulfatase A-like enzyme
MPFSKRIPRTLEHVITALGIALALTTSLAQAQQRPNFVFIALDDLAPLSLHHLNDPSSLLAVAVPNRAARYALSARITPNLNRLASRGVTFSQTWTSYPLCNASRAALLTGIAAARSNYTVQNKYTLRDPRSQLHDAVTLPQRLRQAGYTTLGIGKIFHFAEAKITTRGVKDWPDVTRSWTSYIQQLTGTLGNVAAAPGAGLGRLKFGVELGPTIAQPDWINAGIAATLLRNGSVQTVDRFGFPTSMAIDPSQPFFLGVGIQRPHSPWAVPREWLDLVPGATLQHARIDLGKELEDLDDTYRASKGGRGKFRGVFGFDGTARTARKARRHLVEAIRHYLAAVAFADACVGRVLDALDASPYAQNTVVVLWSDHGYSWGQKLHLGKSSLWEPSLRSEFIAADLRYPPLGRKEVRPVSLQDIYPTICDLAGLGSSEPPLGDGQSLARALHGDRAPLRAILASYGRQQRAIRLGEWKYITYGTTRNNDELYNLDRDPLERSNLIRKAPPAILSRLKNELHRITSRYDTSPDPTPSRPPSIPVGQPAE